MRCGYCTVSTRSFLTQGWAARNFVALRVFFRRTQLDVRHFRTQIPCRHDRGRECAGPRRQQAGALGDQERGGDAPGGQALRRRERDAGPPTSVAPEEGCDATWQERVDLLVDISGVELLIAQAERGRASLNSAIALQSITSDARVRAAVVRSNDNRGVERLVALTRASERAMTASPCAEQSGEEADLPRVLRWILAELATDHGGKMMLQGALGALLAAAERGAFEAPAAAAWACALLSASSDHAMPMVASYGALAPLEALRCARHCESAASGSCDIANRVHPWLHLTVQWRWKTPSSEIHE